MSILLVLYNRAELTLACLRSLGPRLEDAGAEVVLVDNGSRDDTSLLLSRINNATIIRNSDNHGFSHGVNQAAAAARGEYLLLLNNDTELEGDCLGTAMRFLAAQDDVGAVGGRIVLLDGTLQEAGCGVWREGHVLQYGRGDNPESPEYLFQRDVDYCSGTFLMTRRDLFHKLGGLDIAFSPAYFEDVDYCVRLWRAGWRVVFLPDVVVLHHENASSSCQGEILRISRRNHLRFANKHADWLSFKCSSATASPLWARSSHDDRFRVLFLTEGDCCGLFSHLERLRTRNSFVTVYNIDGEELPELPPDVEVIAGNFKQLPGFLEARRGYYEGVLAGDAELLKSFRRLVEGSPGRFASLPGRASCPDHEAKALASARC